MNLAWASPLKKGVTSAVLFFSFVTGAAAAWPHVEPWLAAHRGYVRFVVNENKEVLRDVQLDLANQKRESVEDSKSKWQLELSKAATEQARDLIQQRLRELERIHERLNSQIRSIEAVKERESGK